MKRLVTAVVWSALCLVWWIWISDYASSQNSYHGVIVFAVFVVLATPLHMVAFLRYNRMLRLTLKAEKYGLAEPMSSLVARNQRFRYLVRTLEALYLIVMVLTTIYAIRNPSFGLSKLYGKLFLTYFFGTIAATAWLTWKDLEVLSILNKTDSENAVGGVTPEID